MWSHSTFAANSKSQDIDKAAREAAVKATAKAKADEEAAAKAKADDKAAANATDKAKADEKAAAKAKADEKAAAKEKVEVEAGAKVKPRDQRKISHPYRVTVSVRVTDTTCDGNSGLAPRQRP